MGEGMGAGTLLRRVFEHAGFSVIVRVRSDASAAKASCRKEGFGNIKHMQTLVPWVHYEVGSKRVTLLGVASSDSLRPFGHEGIRNGEVDGGTRGLWIVPVRRQTHISAVEVPA